MLAEQCSMYICIRKNRLIVLDTVRIALRNVWVKSQLDRNRKMVCQVELPNKPFETYF